MLFGCSLKFSRGRSSSRGYVFCLHDFSCFSWPFPLNFAATITKISRGTITLIELQQLRLKQIKQLVMMMFLFFDLRLRLTTTHNCTNGGWFSSWQERRGSGKWGNTAIVASIWIAIFAAFIIITARIDIPAPITIDVFEVRGIGSGYL